MMGREGKCKVKGGVSEESLRKVLRLRHEASWSCAKAVKLRCHQEADAGVLTALGKIPVVGEGETREEKNKMHVILSEIYMNIYT